MKKHIPNTITLLNLFCGLIAIIQTFYNQIDIALLFIVLGAVFDLLDGMVARLLRVSGELGKQLDSLADMVTFGVAPGILLYSITRTFVLENEIEGVMGLIILFSPLLITLFSALRLAKFNIDERQVSGFIGLPTPANTLLIGSLVWMYYHQELPETLINGWFFVLAAVLSSYLLVSPIPLFSFKLKSLKWNENQYQYIFLLIALLMIIWLKIAAIPFVIGVYILMSTIKTTLSKEGN